eukprot:COSAG06_NODE_13386_length_1262_cov_1.465176_3_plen_62_part_01
MFPAVQPLVTFSELLSLEAVRDQRRDVQLPCMSMIHARKPVHVTSIYLVLRKTQLISVAIPS